MEEFDECVYVPPYSVRGYVRRRPERKEPKRLNRYDITNPEVWAKEFEIMGFPPRRRSY